MQDERPVGAPADTPIEGLASDSAFRATLLENRAELDGDEACAATVTSHASDSSNAPPMQ